MKKIHSILAKTSTIYEKRMECNEGEKKKKKESKRKRKEKREKE